MDCERIRRQADYILRSRAEENANAEYKTSADQLDSILKRICT